MRNREELFLAENGVNVEGIDREALLAVFDEEMAAGLAGRPSSLMMIPSFLSIGQPVRTGTPVVVLDAGGTNLRAAVVTLDAAGRPEISAFRKRSMPGTEGELEAEAFFDAFAEFLMPVIDAAETIGFCFSYAAEILPDCDARLIRWSKQIQAPSVEGQRIGAGLKRHLARRGYTRRIVILNDTVATLLAGRSMGVTHDYSAYVGFILGTGTNTAYVERNARITKRTDLDPAGSMVINVESGAFRRVTQSRFDSLMDAETRDPGSYTFEKMISGAYLGSLGLTVLREARKAGLFQPAAAAAIDAWPSLSNKHLDDFCGGRPASDNPFLDAVFTAEDRETVVRLATPLYARAAVLTAVNLASAILKTGEGRDPARPVCVNVDGSTYYRTLTADFRNLVGRELAALLEPRGIAYELIRVEDSPVIGAAVAGLMG
ncbi:MAG TPA: hexokinase [Kiritimatiellia bacterium]|nr:hexokinase [Kiritimatiellia bacterium]HPC48994.1 hexokinase [Kiritimatiellia bacterium]HRU18975.1 hexokinase [Kiritimatiellia bacterium]